MLREAPQWAGKHVLFWNTYDARRHRPCVACGPPRGSARLVPRYGWL